MVGADFAGIINTCISAFAAIAVSIIGVIQVKETKKNAADKKLREENEQLLQEKLQKEKEEQLEEMREMKQMLEKLTNEVSELRKEYDIANIEKQLAQLHFLNEFKIEFIQSLSSVVLIMGDTLATSSTIDDDERDRLRSKVAEHTSKERELTKKLVKIIA